MHGVTEAQFIREALECAACAGLVGRPRRRTSSGSRTNLERQQDAHAAHDVDTFYILDEAFHQTLVEHSGFPGRVGVGPSARRCT